jgi:hypothetical protein
MSFCAYVVYVYFIVVIRKLIRPYGFSLFQAIESSFND